MNPKREGAGRKSNKKDAETMRQLRDAIQKEEGEQIEESKRKAKQAFADKKKRRGDKK